MPGVGSSCVGRSPLSHLMLKCYELPSSVQTPQEASDTQ